MKKFKSVLWILLFALILFAQIIFASCEVQDESPKTQNVEVTFTTVIIDSCEYLQYPVANAPTYQFSNNFPPIVAILC